MRKKLFILGLFVFLVSGFIVLSDYSGVTGYDIFDSVSTTLSLTWVFVIIGIIMMATGNIELRVEKYDAVVIMGRNWRGYPFMHKISPDGKLRLHGASRMNCAVAADMYKKGLAGKIVLGSGKSAGKNFPSEASEMKKYLVHKLEVPAQDVLTHEKNLETYEELDEDLRLARENGLRKLALATVRTQLPKCERYLGEKVEKYIVSEDYAKEELVSEGRRPWRRYAEKYDSSYIPKYEWLKENTLGRLPKSLAKWIARAFRG